MRLYLASGIPAMSCCRTRNTTTKCGHIYPWRRMRRPRALSSERGASITSQFSADCTTNMSGFDLRQARLRLHLTLAGDCVLRIVRKLLHPLTQLRRMNTEVLCGLGIRHAPILDQLGRRDDYAARNPGVRWRLWDRLKMRGFMRTSRRLGRTGGLCRSGMKDILSQRFPGP